MPAPSKLNKGVITYSLFQSRGQKHYHALLVSAQADSASSGSDSFNSVESWKGNFVGTWVGFWKEDLMGCWEGSWRASTPCGEDYDEDISWRWFFFTADQF